MTLRKIIILVFILVVVIVGFVFIRSYLQTHSYPFFKTSTVSIDNHTYTVIVVKTDKERQVGLSERQSLSLDQGMLFTFDKPDLYLFWMKNMKFPIDIIFINNNHIVTIH